MMSARPHLLESQHSLGVAGAVGMLECPKCEQIVANPVIGCANCIPAAALLYAAHLAEQHPEFIEDIKAATP